VLSKPYTWLSLS